jgi:PAP2 superfamily protein
VWREECPADNTIEVEGTLPAIRHWKMRNEPECQHRESLATAALAAAVGLGVLATMMADAPPTAMDTRIRRRVIRSTTPRSRRVIHLLTGPGHPSVYFPITALLVMQLRRRGLSGGNALLFAAVGGWATHGGIKLFVRRRRPRTMHGRSNEFEAFPSGHTTASTAIALTAAHVLARHGVLSRSSATSLAVVAPAAIGVGRVLADHHWTTDVIGGWIGGAGVAAVAALAFESLEAISPEGHGYLGSEAIW